MTHVPSDSSWQDSTHQNVTVLFVSGQKNVGGGRLGSCPHTSGCLRGARQERSTDIGEKCRGKVGG